MSFQDKAHGYIGQIDKEVRQHHYPIESLSYLRMRMRLSDEKRTTITDLSRSFLSTLSSTT